MKFWKKNRLEMFGRNVPINKIVVSDYNPCNEQPDGFKNRYLHGWPVREKIGEPVSGFVFTFRDKAVTYEFTLDEWELARICDLIDKSKLEDLTK